MLMLGGHTDTLGYYRISWIDQIASPLFFILSNSESESFTVVDSDSSIVKGSLASRFDCNLDSVSFLGTK